MVLRDAVPADLAAVQRIYAHHVETGFASFEETAPDLAEIGRRLADIRARGLPWLAAVADGAVAGYAYAAPYRARSAYRYSVEDSVYLDPAFVGRGIGRGLLDALIAAASAAGMRQMVAVIGDSANAASVGLHRACGFAPVGTLRSVGFKQGRWVDSVLMQRPLGKGDTAPP